MKRLYVVPDNDAEARRIVQLLQKTGAEFVVTKQRWGATWDGLEPNVKAVLSTYNGEVIGVELGGHPLRDGFRNIDHHIYYDKEGHLDDRSNAKSSLEQVADLEGVALSTQDQFFAANDRGYMKEMQALGARLGLSPVEVQLMIYRVNALEDEMLGITPQDREIAVEAIDQAYVYDERLIRVEYPNSVQKLRAVTNALYGHSQNLLIHCQLDNSVVFFGEKRHIQRLVERFPGGWSGGDPEFGYWGIHIDDVELQYSAPVTIRDFVEQEVLGYHRLLGKPDILASTIFEQVRINEIKNPETFHAAILQAKQENTHGAFVHAHETDEYGGMRCFIVNTGVAGIAVMPDGDIVSVFKNPVIARSDSVGKMTPALLLQAVAAGGTKLDCFDKFLPDLYMSFGFIPATRVPFNREFAPEEWNYREDGEPDIVFFYHNGDSVHDVIEKHNQGAYPHYIEYQSSIPVFQTYEAAFEYRDAALRAHQEHVAQSQKGSQAMSRYRIVLGVNRGYFHGNEQSDAATIVQEVWASPQTEGAVVGNANTVYRTEWGCPVGGEKTAVVLGPYTSLSDLVERTKEVKQTLGQWTVTIETTQQGGEGFQMTDSFVAEFEGDMDTVAKKWQETAEAVWNQNGQGIYISAVVWNESDHVVVSGVRNPQFTQDAQAWEQNVRDIASQISGRRTTEFVPVNFLYLNYEPAKTVGNDTQESATTAPDVSESTSAPTRTLKLSKAPVDETPAQEGPDKAQSSRDDVR